MNFVVKMMNSAGDNCGDQAEEVRPRTPESKTESATSLATSVSTPPHKKALMFQAPALSSVNLKQPLQDTSLPPALVWNGQHADLDPPNVTHPPPEVVEGARGTPLVQLQGQMVPQGMLPPPAICI